MPVQLQPWHKLLPQNRSSSSSHTTSTTTTLVMIISRLGSQQPPLLRSSQVVLLLRRQSQRLLQQPQPNVSLHQLQCQDELIHRTFYNTSLQQQMDGNRIMQVEQQQLQQQRQRQGLTSYHNNGGQRRHRSISNNSICHPVSFFATSSSPFTQQQQQQCRTFFSFGGNNTKTKETPSSYALATATATSQYNEDSNNSHVIFDHTVLNPAVDNPSISTAQSVYDTTRNQLFAAETNTNNSLLVFPVQPDKQLAAKTTQRRYKTNSANDKQPLIEPVLDTTCITLEASHSGTLIMRCCIIFSCSC
jgi:hypothetical protein